MVVISLPTARSLINLVKESNLDAERKKEILDELIDAVRDALETSPSEVYISVAEAESIIRDFASRLEEEINRYGVKHLSQEQLDDLLEIVDDIENETIEILRLYKEEE